jgi:hypothetical protein
VAHVKLCVLALMIQRAAEIAAGAPWSQLVNVLERLKAVRYTCEGETIVQASRATPELAAILNKLDISRPKPILAVGTTPLRHSCQRPQITPRVPARSPPTANSGRTRLTGSRPPRNTPAIPRQ